MKPCAGLSVDVDSITTHLQGYGYRVPGDDGLVYEQALPRMLKLFRALGARATFFVVVEEALRYPDLIRQIVAEGHEVACHSLTHPAGIHRLGEAHLYDEIVYARSVLEQLTGRSVVGFRSPSWYLTDSILACIAEAGYWYDATAYPSPLLVAARLEIRRRGRERERAFEGWHPLWEQVFGRRAPYLVHTERGSFLELPITVLTPLRIPFYHTLRWVLPRSIWSWMRRSLDRVGYVTYVLHAVDFLGADVDPIDKRLLVHPGMRLPLGYKLREARRVLEHELGAYRLIPLGELPLLQLIRMREQLQREVVT
ncbi:MAG: polysaccharide deacetylase family protein [Rhodothermia bacterium]|nr:polysaccharide deacetylase family protein [Rhodothermia bacterium]